MGRITGLTIWMLPALCLAALGLVFFSSGVAADRAFPVPVYMIINHTMPENAYADAASQLEAANDHDGDALLAKAEAQSHIATPHPLLIAEIKQALSRAPASARGWTMLAEVCDAKCAGPAMALALSLAPHDYWLAGRRARDAAGLWDVLPESAQRQALDEARLLWEEPALRKQIAPLLAAKGGPALMTRALADNPEDIRALNRWLSAETRKRR